MWTCSGIITYAHNSNLSRTRALARESTSHCLLRLLVSKGIRSWHENVSSRAWPGMLKLWRVFLMGSGTVGRLKLLSIVTMALALATRLKGTPRRLMAA